MSGRNGKEPEDWICYPDEWISNRSDVDLRSPSVVSIFRVPNVLITYSEKREAYVPTRVSLGPYHNRTAELRPMDIHKRRALHRMASRRFNINVRNLSVDPNNMDFYIRAKHEILQLENNIRDNYEEKLECEEETLAQMLCLDGCFIIEILRTLSGDVHGASNYFEYEPIFKTTNRTTSDILLDILKLENQVPLIVLQKLLELELNSAKDAENMLKEMILPFYPFDSDIHVWSWPQRDEEKVHLLGLLRTLLFSERGRYEEKIRLCDNYSQEQIAINDIISIPRAIKLRNAGIKFKGCNGGIEEINFDSKSGTISLPCIIISDFTEILFRNLIAFEMCNSSDHINYVACYVVLMDQLIDTEEDVALLRKMGIVTNCFGSDKEVAQLFNGLGKGVSVNLEKVFNQVTRKVNQHYKNNWNTESSWNGYYAELKTDYFSSPWKIIGLVAAFVLLVLTFVQTLFNPLLN